MTADETERLVAEVQKVMPDKPYPGNLPATEPAVNIRMWFWWRDACAKLVEEAEILRKVWIEPLQAERDALAAKLVEWKTAWATARDWVLNARGPLAETELNGYAPNDVLSVLDDHEPKDGAGRSVQARLEAGSVCAETIREFIRVMNGGEYDPTKSISFPAAMAAFDSAKEQR